MIQTLDLRGTRPTRAELVALVPRARVDVAVASETAAGLIAEVREHGEDALRDQAERLDRVRPDVVRIDPATITAAVGALDPAVRDAIEEAIARVRTRQRGAGAAARRDRSRRRGRDRPALAAGRAGRLLRPRRQGRLPVERHHERRARPRSRA